MHTALRRLVNLDNDGETHFAKILTLDHEVSTWLNYIGSIEIMLLRNLFIWSNHRNRLQKTQNHDKRLYVLFQTFLFRLTL